MRRHIYLQKEILHIRNIHMYRGNIYVYIRRHACTRGDLAVNICHWRVLCTPRAYLGNSTTSMRPGRASIWPVPDVTFHYTILYRIKLHYTTLHDTTRHDTTRHYATRHYTTLHYTTLCISSRAELPPDNYTLHYTTLH